MLYKIKKPFQLERLLWFLIDCAIGFYFYFLNSSLKLGVLLVK